jgi:hypothetical protein
MHPEVVVVLNKNQDFSSKTATSDLPISISITVLSSSFFLPADAI